jgi:hypothetical protein
VPTINNPLKSIDSLASAEVVQERFAQSPSMRKRHPLPIITPNGQSASNKNDREYHQATYRSFDVHYRPIQVTNRRNAHPR